MSCCWAQYRTSVSYRSAMPPYSERWTLVSMKPGTTNLPVPSIVCAPVGTRVVSRGPTADTRPALTTMTALGTGARPLPSMSVAPTTASEEAWAPSATTAAPTAKSRPQRRRCMPRILYHQPDRYERFIRRSIERRTERAMLHAVGFVADRAKLGQELVGRYARSARELCGVQLRENHRPIVVQEAHRAANHLRLGAFHVHLDEPHRSLDLQLVERDDRNAAREIARERRGTVAQQVGAASVEGLA